MVDASTPVRIGLAASEPGAPSLEIHVGRLQKTFVLSAGGGTITVPASEQPMTYDLTYSIAGVAATRRAPLSLYIEF